MHTTTGFLHEERAYGLLAAAGLRVPRHGFLDAGPLPFAPGEPIVLKGIADQLWHKSDKGAVHFGPFDEAALRAEAEAMRQRVAEHPWIGGLVCEKVAFKRLGGLPTEALVSLKRDPDAGWLVICGIGGLQADAWAVLAPPLIWPLALCTPDQALTDLRDHWLGRTWLGRQRGTEALTEEPKLLAFLQGLWRAAEGLEREGVTLLELNPVVLDGEGLPTALDGVGTLDAAVAAPPAVPDPAWYRALVAPRDLVIAGVSSRAGTVGRIILENAQRSTLPAGAIRLIKPGATEFLGLPCIESVADLAAAPTDQLIVSLPAPVTLEVVEQLCRQGGGATVVYVVAGGLGDGADTEGLGQRLVACLEEHRRAGKWTPALVGPNGLGLYSPDQNLNTLFIPDEKLPLRPRSGHAALVSQSGAFLITRLSRRPELGLRAAVAIGNQMDLRCSDFLAGFGSDPAVQVVGAYLEGFAPGDLKATAEVAAKLRATGRRVLLYKGGRSQEGMAAASSHTGALAGDHALQASVLRRAGVMLAERIEAFDAALSWLGAYAKGTPRRVAILTNAGFESVASADLLEGPFRGSRLTEAETADLTATIEAHGLTGLVSPRLPLDLTPMADEAAYLAGARLLLASEADVVVVGLVPLTRRLGTADPAAFGPFARALAALASGSGKWLGVAVEGGVLYDAYRQGLREAGLPVFLTMEEALEGLRLIASEV
ncbi:acetate--CoA ligase family protein [Geothrix edaphica]|uniref:CoA-binding protein n=1 Tax=Geothrix edaphica TaxID=2927976 RepID=A0ABQ5PYC3_9BACT|nr:acetate--CoA ligase family protein [Geothrix edaphica]GLH67368.1 CoA-binding protein [Geothrix edaphica]